MDNNQMDIISGLKERGMTYIIRSIFSSLTLMEQVKCRGVSSLWKRTVEENVMPGWDRNTRMHHRWLNGKVSSVIAGGMGMISTLPLPAASSCNLGDRVYIVAKGQLGHNLTDNNWMVLAYNKKSGVLVAQSKLEGTENDYVGPVGKEAFSVKGLIVIVFARDMWFLNRDDLSIKASSREMESCEEVWLKAPGELCRAMVQNLVVRVDLLDVQTCQFVPLRQVDLQPSIQIQAGQESIHTVEGSKSWFLIKIMDEDQADCVVINVDTGKVDWQHWHENITEWDGQAESLLGNLMVTRSENWTDYKILNLDTKVESAIHLDLDVSREAFLDLPEVSLKTCILPNKQALIFEVQTKEENRMTFVFDADDLERGNRLPAHVALNWGTFESAITPKLVVAGGWRDVTRHSFHLAFKDGDGPTRLLRMPLHGLGVSDPCRLCSQFRLALDETGDQDVETCVVVSYDSGHFHLLKLSH